jgi:hypothetical protein
MASAHIPIPRKARDWARLMTDWLIAIVDIVARIEWIRLGIRIRVVECRTAATPPILTSRGCGRQGTDGKGQQNHQSNQTRADWLGLVEMRKNVVHGFVLPGFDLPGSKSTVEFTPH